MPEEDLARTGDLLLAVAEHLVPLREPADGPADREEDGEEVGREAHRLVDEARVEVDVRVELPLDEVVVLERDPLQLDGDRQERVLPGDLEDLVGEPLDDLRARVVVLVDAVAEAHQLLLALAFLDLLDEGGDVLHVADLAEHPEDRLVRAAVQRPVERRDRARDTGVRVGLGGADAAHDARRAVLLVVGVEDEEDVERLLEDRVHDVLRLGHLPEHREEVAGVGELVVGVDVGEADGVPVGERRDRRHLRHEPDRVVGPLALVVDQLGVGIEGGERGDGRLEHPHRVRVVTEPFRELLDVLVEVGVRRDVAREPLELVLRRELAVPEEPGHLEEARLLGELLDRDSRDTRGFPCRRRCR